LGQLGFGSIGLAGLYKKQDVAFTSPRRRSLAEGESLGVASFWKLERSRQVRLTLQALNPLFLATVITILGWYGFYQNWTLNVILLSYSISHLTLSVLLDGWTGALTDEQYWKGIEFLLESLASSSNTTRIYRAIGMDSRGFSKSDSRELEKGSCGRHCLGCVLPLLVCLYWGPPQRDRALSLSPIAQSVSFTVALLAGSFAFWFISPKYEIDENGDLMQVNFQPTVAFGVLGGNIAILRAVMGSWLDKALSDSM